MRAVFASLDGEDSKAVNSSGVTCEVNPPTSFFAALSSVVIWSPNFRRNSGCLSSATFSSSVEYSASFCFVVS
jgi:hypothetical protein